VECATVPLVGAVWFKLVVPVTKQIATMPVGCQPALQIAGKGEQDAGMGVGGATQQLIRTRAILHDILAPRHFSLEREFAKHVIGSEVVCLQVRYIIGSSNDIELELEHCWGLGLSLEVPMPGLEDAHRFPILSALHVPLGAGGTAVLPALQLSLCSGSGIDRHRLGRVARS
jgi:hypothetical protein